MRLFIAVVFAGITSALFKFSFGLSDREALIAAGVLFLGSLIDDVAGALRDVATAIQRHE